MAHGEQDYSSGMKDVGPTHLIEEIHRQHLEIKRLRDEILELSERYNNAAKEINRLKGAAGHPKDDGTGG